MKIKLTEYKSEAGNNLDNPSESESEPSDSEENLGSETNITHKKDS